MKLLAFFCRKQGMSLTEFRDYYENNHVPLIQSLTTVPFGYKRSYFQHDDELNTCTAPFQCDVVTEIEFASRATFEQFRTEIFAPGAGERLIADELRFMDRSRQWIIVIDEQVSTILDAQEDDPSRRMKPQ